MARPVDSADLGKHEAAMVYSYFDQHDIGLICSLMNSGSPFLDESLQVIPKILIET